MPFPRPEGVRRVSYVFSIVRSQRKTGEEAESRSERREKGRKRRRKTHLKTAQHISFGIRMRLALLKDDGGGKFVVVLADESLKSGGGKVRKRAEEEKEDDALEHYRLTLQDRRILPLIERLLCLGGSAVEVSERGFRDASEEVLRRRVTQVDPLLRRASSPLATDEVESMATVGSCALPGRGEVAGDRVGGGGRGEGADARLGGEGDATEGGGNHRERGSKSE
jgi:hypothetical protein